MICNRWDQEGGPDLEMFTSHQFHQNRGEIFLVIWV